MLLVSSIYADASSEASTSKLPHWPDAILGIKPKGLLLPGAGGKVGRAGDAALGYASAKPFPIWCVLEETDHPEQRNIATQAIACALEIAASRGCQSIGLWVDHRTTKLMQPDELVSIALLAFKSYPGTQAFRSFHIFRSETDSPADVPTWG
jgi:hypothetical protein